MSELLALPFIVPHLVASRTAQDTFPDFAILVTALAVISVAGVRLAVGGLAQADPTRATVASGADTGTSTDAKAPPAARA